MLNVNPSNDKYLKSNYEYRYIIKESGIIYDKLNNRYISIVYNGRDIAYPVIRLVDNTGIENQLVLHKLLATIFIPNPENKPFVNHIDGDKSNFELNNLEWVTSSENTQKAFDNKQMDNNFKVKSNYKLSEDTILEVIEMILLGYDNETIGEKYNLHPRYISLIRHKKRWKDIWNQKFQDIIPPNSAKTYKQNITDNYYNIPISKQIEIIESLRFKTNIEVAKSCNIDPSVISRVRFQQTWYTGLKLHKEKISIPIPLYPIINFKIPNFILNRDNKLEKEKTLLSLINYILPYSYIKENVNDVNMVNLYSIWWIILHFNITKIPFKITFDHMVKLSNELSLLSSNR